MNVTLWCGWGCLDKVWHCVTGGRGGREFPHCDVALLQQKLMQQSTDFCVTSFMNGPLYFVCIICLMCTFTAQAHLQLCFYKQFNNRIIFEFIIVGNNKENAIKEVSNHKKIYRSFHLYLHYIQKVTMELTILYNSYSRRTRSLRLLS